MKPYKIRYECNYFPEVSALWEERTEVYDLESGSEEEAIRAIREKRSDPWYSARYKLEVKIEEMLPGHYEEKPIRGANPRNKLFRQVYDAFVAD